MTNAKIVVPALVAAAFVLSPAASAQDWDELAQCESTGNWSIDTGNGYSGGLQFSPSTWAAFGGTEYAANAADASRSQQIAVAERVLEAQGPGAWPACSAKTSWESGSTETPLNGPESNADGNNAENGSSVVSEPTPVTQNASGDYTVSPGDTLGAIAAAHDMTWDQVFEQNTEVLTDPHLIYPGQVLNI